MRILIGLWPALGALLAGGASAAETSAPGDYVVQPGDVLAVSVWKEDDLSQEILVRPDGKFSFPLTGDIVASGRAVEAIRQDIITRITTYIPEPVVTVQVRQILGNKVYVIGKVNRPGEFIVSHQLDVMQALAMAGGTAIFARLKDIVILRRTNGQQNAIAFNYSEVQDGEHLEQNVLLEPGDVVVVP